MTYQIREGVVTELSISRENWGNRKYVVGRFRINGTEYQYLYLPDSALSSDQEFIRDGDELAICVRVQSSAEKMVCAAYNKSSKLGLGNDWRFLFGVTLLALAINLPFFMELAIRSMHGEGFANPIFRLFVFVGPLLMGLAILGLTSKLRALGLIKRKFPSPSWK